MSRQIVHTLITSLDDKAIRSIDKKSLTDLIEYTVHVFKRQGLTAKHHEVREILYLELHFRYLDSKYLDKRLHGLAEIKHIIKCVLGEEDMKKNGNAISSRLFSSGASSSLANPSHGTTSRTSTSQDVIVPLWVDKKYIIRWIEDKQLLEVIFCKDIHPELIRQSRPILLFLSECVGLQSKDIDIIWRASVGKHEATQRIIYELIISIIANIKIQVVNLFYAHIESLTLSQLNTKHTIQFVKQFTIESVISSAKIKEKKRRWYGLDLFWVLMMNNSDVPPDLAARAFRCMQQLVQRDEFASQRKRLIKACIENVKNDYSVPQSLSLLQTIISSYPHTRRRKKNTVRGKIEHLNDKYKLLDLFFEDVQRFKKHNLPASHVTSIDVEQILPESNRHSNASNITVASICIPEDPHHDHASGVINRDQYINHVTQRLEFLTFMLTNSSSVRLTFKDVMILWRAFYEEAHVEQERFAFVQWLDIGRNQDRRFQLFSDDVSERLFREVIMKLDCKTMDRASFILFYNFFIDVNVRHKLLEVEIAVSDSHGRHAGSNPNTLSLDTKATQAYPGVTDKWIRSGDKMPNGVDTMNNQGVSNRIQAKLDRMLLRFYRKMNDLTIVRRWNDVQKAGQEYEGSRQNRTYLVRDEELIGFEQLWNIVLDCQNEDIAQEALHHLNYFRSHFSKDIRPFCGSQRERHVNQCMEELRSIQKRLNVAPRADTSLVNADDINGNGTTYSLSGPVSQDEMVILERRAGRCLDLLLNYVDIFAKHERDRSHGIVSIGIPISVRIAVVDGVRLKLTIQSTNTVGRLMQLISSEINHPAQFLRLFSSGLALDDQSKTLDDLRIKDKQLIIVKKIDFRDVGLHLLQFQLHALDLGPLSHAISKQLVYKYQQQVILNSNDSDETDSTPLSPADEHEFHEFGDTTSVTSDSSFVTLIVDGDDYKTYPARILSQNDNFHTLMSLFDLLHCDFISERVWMILLRLPTNDGILDLMHGIFTQNLSSVIWEDLIPVTSVYRMLYSLQVLDLSLKRLRRHSMMDVNRWYERFVQLGGFDHLLCALFQDDITRRFSRTPLHQECLSLLLKKISIFLPSYLAAVSLEQRTNLLVRIVDVVLNLPISTNLVQSDGLRSNNSSNGVNQSPRSTSLSSLSEDQSHDISDLRIDAGCTYRAVIEQVISLLITCTSISSEAASVVYSHPLLPGFIRSSLLECEFKDIRHEVAEGILKLLACKESEQQQQQQQVAGTSDPPHGSITTISNRAFQFFIPFLFSFINEIDNYQSTCEQYFILLAKLLAMNRGPIEAERFDEKKALADLITKILKRPIYEGSDVPEDEDKVLVGLLNTARFLLRMNQDLKVEVGSSASVGLVREIFLSCLFEVPVHGSATMTTDCKLPPKCKSNASRTAAFKMLIELVEDCKENLNELLELITEYLLETGRTTTNHYYGFNPSVLKKPPLGYVGLINQGATCYMNSLIQQFFMIAPFRKGLFSVTLEDPNRDDNTLLLHEFQIMLGFLQDSAKKYYDSRSFFMSYKDIDGNTMSISQQQDANEFCHLFLDKIEAALNDTQQKHLLHRVFGGKILNQLLYDEHVSETEEPFYILSLEIKNKKNIMESLELYTHGEMLEGDNKYYSDKLKCHVDALKRALVKDLPNVLVLHLKRFEFDYERMRNLKINDRCEFPLELDMEPYTVEGTYRRENRDMSHLPHRDPSYYHFKLVGVLVHTGTADSGHYYSFIMDRQRSAESQQDTWIEFNDTKTLPFDISDLENECFGGMHDILTEERGNGPKNTATRIQRSNNAYMLFYQRSSTIYETTNFEDYTAERSDEGRSSRIVETTPMTTDSTPDTPLNSPMLSPSESNTTKDSLWHNPAINALRFIVKMSAKTRRKHMARMKQSDMPSYVKQMVWSDNSLFFHDMNVFNVEFDSFLFNLLSTIENMTQTYALEESDIFRVAIELSMNFVIEVLIRSVDAASATEKWLQCMSRMLARSHTASRSFLDKLSSNANWCIEVFLRCPYPFVRVEFCNMAIICVKKLRDTESYEQQSDDNVKHVLVQPDSMENTATGATAVISVRPSHQKSTIMDFMERVLQLLNDARFFCSHATELFQFLAKFALLGYKERCFLVSREIISNLVVLLSGSAASLSTNSSTTAAATTTRSVGYSSTIGQCPPSDIFGRQALHHVISLISLLIRTCETTATKSDDIPLPPGMMRSNEEAAINMSNNDRDKLFHRPFFASLVQCGCNLQALQEILIHWCWYNTSISLNFATLIVDNLKDDNRKQYMSESTVSATPLSTMNHFLTVLEALLGISDPHSQTRVHKILDKYLKHLTDVQQQGDLVRDLIVFLTKISKHNEHVKQWMLENFERIDSICRLHGMLLKGKSDAGSGSGNIGKR